MCSKKGRIAWNKDKKCPQISIALKNSEKFKTSIHLESRNRKISEGNKLESDQIKKQKEKGKRVFRLSVHHIDEDKEQGCNGKSWKLVPLCLQCHLKVKKHKILSL
jgi:hypothetical protein